MSGRVQVAISADGTEIVGRVRGQGPPLVLVHGGWGDGEVAYDALVPHLDHRFTCYTPSTRGRGLSRDNPDHSVRRLIQDVTAFIDTIGEPVYLVGWSGIEPPLGAAIQNRAVSAVALFEGYVPPVAEQGDLVNLGTTIDRTAAAAANGRLADAARAFAPFVLTDAERAALDEDFFSDGDAASRRCSSTSSRTCPRRDPGRTTLSSGEDLRTGGSPCGAGRPPADGSRNRRCT